MVYGAIQMLKGQWRLSLEVLDTQLGKICFKKKCDLDVGRLSDLEDEIANQISVALHRPLARRQSHARRGTAKSRRLTRNSCVDIA